MNISIPEQYISPCVPSQTPMKRPLPASTTPTGRKQQKRKRSWRTLSEDDQGDEAYNSHLSAAAKNRVLKLRKIQDPFDSDLQQVVDDVFNHFEEQAGGEVDLAESALLLSSVTQVYSKQIKTLHEEIMAIAERLTGRPNPLKKNRKKKGEGDIENAQETPGAIEKTDAAAEGEGLQSAENAINENDTADNTATHEDNSEATPDSLETPAEEPTASTSVENSQALNETELHEVKPAENPGEIVKLDEPEPTVEEVQNLEQPILDEIAGRCTRRQSDRLKNVLSLEKVKEREYTLKKKKYDEDPPDLISCHDEWDAILANIEDNIDMDLDELPPPVLEVMVGRKRKYVEISNDDEHDDDGNFEACQNSCEDGDEPQPVVDMKCELVTQSAIPAATDADSADARYDTLDHLSIDMQEKFHLLVQEMHKLPFDYDLKKPDVLKAYHQKFLQAVSILSQHSVLLKRSEEDNPTVSPEPLELNDSQMSESDQAISSIAELLNQVRQQAADDYKLNKGKQTKSDAEVPISQMIATLKRIICSRYKKWHVRTDGDKAVYRRIREFEDRVKAVLKREAEQGLFDVRKYELEVMDVTIKESHEIDIDEFTCPLSPIMAPDGAGSPRLEDSRNLVFGSPSRRSSLNGSVDGSSWISLIDIFSHMKKLDPSETCRHFYAILALLSSKNLAINYDSLVSQESAKLITKIMKKGRAGDPEKYPVGAKIMTSRCPDIDRDEVMLTPALIPESLRRALAQNGYLSPSDYQSDSQASGSGDGYLPHRTIEDVLKDFVSDDDDDDEPFTEDVLSK